ncbi:Pentapeptide repeats (8 copies) [Caballeronia peredens]|nr:Pentapeptide repeats (8 copies) [Caballeronia peredens]
MVMPPRKRILKRASVRILHWARALTREEFHFWVDVTTLIASVATVVTLVLLLIDRPQQANIAAWTLLQTYLHDEKRPQFEEGQSYALETLAKNGVPMVRLDGHGIIVFGANLEHAIFSEASFQLAHFTFVSLNKAQLQGADLRSALIYKCDCRNADFTIADLRGAVIMGGDFAFAKFSQADISGMTISSDRDNGDPRFSPGAFDYSCYAANQPPDNRSSAVSTAAKDPQSGDCEMNREHRDLMYKVLKKTIPIAD